MKRIGITIFSLLLSTIIYAGQKSSGSPTDAVLNFYRALKAKQYVEGFRHSVFRNAVEGLTPAELSDLEPDFNRTFSAIPDKIEPHGEQIKGETAVVFLKFEGMEGLQQVALVRSGGEWLVGDEETLGVVRAQGRAFFFNARITVNENETGDMLSRIIGAEVIYSQKYEGRNATLEELIALGGVPKDLEGGQSSGYKFTLAVSGDRKSFSATALPIVYGKTGRLSFYADINGVHAEDLKGRPASANSPVYKK